MSSKRALFAFSVVTVLLPGVARAATGDVVTSFPSSFPSPDGLMWDGSFLWATDCSYSRIDKVDPASGQVVGSIDIPGVNSDELAWDGEAMWVSDHTATEMPTMNAPPPRLYRVDPASQAVLGYFDAPGQAKYPMGVAWDGDAVWNVDTWDKVIYRLDPGTGAVLRSLPAPASGSCGMTWDGACLWLSDAATDGLVYHIDPANGEVLRTFAGPGGPGHQATGVAWDGKHLWVHDEAVGRAAIHQLEIEDITEAGRCAGAFQVPDPSPPGSAPAEEATASAGCSVYLLREADRASPWTVGAAAVLLFAGAARRRRSAR
ncbi:MAG: hypothetical protein HY908_09400 [Myxococcales bacterium]|nr:hypothetical protein [Myxococcales bacterium]